MSDLASRALRKRISLPNHFTSTVMVEHVALHDDALLARVRRADGGLEDVVLEVAELEEALARATSAGAELDYAKRDAADNPSRDPAQEDRHHPRRAQDRPHLRRDRLVPARRGLEPRRRAA